MKVLLVIYDNTSFIHWFPTGVAYIAAVLRNIGCEVEIYNQDQHHYTEEHLSKYLDEKKFDVIGLGVIAGYYQYRKLLKISEAINKSKNRPLYIIAGHGPTPEPDYFLRKSQADIAILGEGEETIVDIIDAVSNKKSFKDIKGIAYRDGNKTIINERRELIENIDSIPLPAYDLFPIDYYKLIRLPRTTVSDFALPMISGRGCTFECNFCYRMDQGFRPRSNESIIEEIKLLKTNYGINFIVFADELLMSSKERTMSICEDFIKAKLDIHWNCNGRLNYAKPEIIELMSKAGCVFINYGIEAFDDQVLKNMNKALTTKQITAGIETTLKYGISPGLNIIFGNIGDNKETLQKGVDFLLKYDDCSQMRTIRPVTPYPGSPLYYYAIEKGLLKDCEDFYENKHLNSDLVAVNFTDMTDKEFHEALFEANKILIKNHHDKKAQMFIDQAQKLYLETDVEFRGFRTY